MQQAPDLYQNSATGSLLLPTVMKLGHIHRFPQIFLNSILANLAEERSSDFCLSFLNYIYRYQLETGDAHDDLLGGDSFGPGAII